MKQSLFIVSVLSAFLIISAFDIGGIDLVLAGITLSVNTAIRSALLILASFIIIGQLNVLLTKDVIEKWLQKFKGIKAVIIGALAGGLFPAALIFTTPLLPALKTRTCPFMYSFHLYSARKSTMLPACLWKPAWSA